MDTATVTITLGNVNEAPIHSAPETQATNAESTLVFSAADGNAISVEPCYGDYRVDPEDDCLAPARERAWSSPIFVDHASGAALRAAPRD